MKSHGALLVVLTLAALPSCTGASGRFQGTGGPGGDWAMRPNQCQAKLGRVIDLYYQGERAADTEVVVRDGEQGQEVWVRIPGKHKMAILRQADCTTFLVSTNTAGYTINDGEVLTGRVRLECSRPEIGRVTGEATFVCN